MLKPRSDCILVKPEIPEQKTKSGIILAVQEHQSQYEREIFSNQGLVMAKGSRVSEVEVGDKVIFQRWGATELDVDGEKLLLINERDFLVKY